MPYRRLPKTDKGRLKALKTAVALSETLPFNSQVLSTRTFNEAKTFLNTFEQKLQQYKHNFEQQVESNKNYQLIVSQARMYISHFIQVLNLAVLRGEIKRESKIYYGLNPEQNALPNLNTEKAILNWGEAVIKGELERIKNGGSPIYNPAIAKVRVHYDIFKEHCNNQKLHQSSTNDRHDELSALREQAEKIVLDIWNQVEAYFKNELPADFLENCQAFGVVYYYRRCEDKT
jgi:hypothetical protein